MSKLSQINTENVKHPQVTCLIDRVAQIDERQAALASLALVALKNWLLVYKRSCLRQER